MSAKTNNFLNKIKSGALQLWSKFGILPSVAAGQAALESAWGASSLSTKYNNLFGIKGSYQGNSAMMNTWEVYGGQRYDIKAGFRAYPDWATSILDYGVFLTVNQRYKAAIGVSDYKSQISAIHKAGYATDPQYAAKVINIIESYGLDSWDKEVLNEKKTPAAPKPQVAGVSNDDYLHIVKAGDTLSGIAAKNNLTVEYLKNLNNIPNPHLIYPGQRIMLKGKVTQPSEPAKKYHKVVRGDTVSVLAQKYGSTISQIKAWNNLDAKYTIYAGKTIRVK